MAFRRWWAPGIVKISALMILFTSLLPLITAGAEETRAPLILTGTISEDTVLDAGYYRLGNLTIDKGASVYVPTGTVFYFNSSSEITIKGELILDGKEDSWISFVSYGGGSEWGGIRVEGGTLIENYTTMQGTCRAIYVLENSTLRLKYTLINNTVVGLTVVGANVVNILNLEILNASNHALYISGEGYEVQDLKVRRCKGNGMVLHNVSNSIFSRVDLKVEGERTIEVSGNSRHLTISDFYLTTENESEANSSGIYLAPGVSDLNLYNGHVQGSTVGVLSEATGSVMIVNTTISAETPLKVSGSGGVEAHNCDLSGSPSIFVDGDSARVDLYNCTFSDVAVSGDNATVTAYYGVSVRVVDQPLNRTLTGSALRIVTGEGEEILNTTLENGVINLTLPTDLWTKEGRASPFNPYTFLVQAGEDPYVNQSTLMREIHGPTEVVIYVNLPPIFRGECVISFAEDSHVILNLSQFFSDPEGENLTFSINSSQNLIVSLNNSSLNISAKKDYFGLENLTITAVDESGATTRVVLTVNITGINDPPYINSPPDWNITVRAGERFTLNLSDMLGDVDTPVENLTVRVENCTYASVNGTLLTFLFPLESTINTTYAVIVVSDGEMETSRILRINVVGGGGGGQETKVNITYAEVSVKKNGEWVVKVRGTPNSTIYIVVEGVGSFKLMETSPGNYTATIPGEMFEEGKRYRYHFSDREGGEDIAPALSGEVEVQERAEKKGLAPYAVVAVIALVVLGVLVYLFTRNKEEAVEE